MILAVGTFVLGVDGFVLPGLLPRISASLSVSLATAGQLTTAFALAYAIGSPVIATLTGRMDRRIVITAGMITFLAGMMLQAAGPTYPVVLAGRIVAALGAAAFQANAFALAGVLATPERRARAFAMIGAGSSLAAVVGVPFGLAIAEWLGWRGTMWTLAALAAIAATVTLIAAPSVRLPSSTLSERAAVLVDPRILILLLVSALVMAPLFMVSSYAAAVIGASTASASALLIALVVFGVGFFTGNRLVARYADKLDSLTLVTTALGVVICASAALRLVLHSFLPVLAPLFVLGLAGSFLFIPQQNRLFLANPNDSTAAIALSLNGSMNYASIALGTALGGLVLTTASVLWLPIGSAALAATVIVVAQLTAPERHRQTAPAETARLCQQE